MRALCVVCGLAISLAPPTGAMAQSALEGPLAAPDAPPAKPTAEAPAKGRSAKVKPGHHKPKTARYDPSSQPIETTKTSPKEQQPVAHARRDTPTDPVSFGMKWSGSNDTAKDTRVQNYDGSAAGTGGAVGLNFHF